MDNLSIQNTMPDHHSPPLILIADDHVDSVDLLEQRLENAGYRTAGAYDGEEALAQVEKLHPDLLLLDLLMPKLSGIEVVAQLRGKPEFQDLPIIMLTAKTEMGDRIAGLDAGADEYLTKPTEEGELLARVRAMLRMREALHSKQHLEEENERLRREVALREGWEEFVGHSEPMQEVYGLIEKVAAAPAAVLITGETGTGKEILAKMSEKGDFIFAIIDKKTDKLIGNCGFHNINAVNQRAEFGIFIGDKNCQNKGFGTEAGKLLLDFGFNILNLNNILLEVYSFNERAIKAYEKMGFKHIGKQREAKIMTGKKYDKIFMDMLATEFREKNDSKLKI